MITQKRKKGSNCFTTFYCSICHKDKLLVLLDKYKDKLLDNPKIYDLIKAWEDYGFSTDTLNLVRCIPPNLSNVHAACNECRFILRPTLKLTTHLKPSSSKEIEVTKWDC